MVFGLGLRVLVGSCCRLWTTYRVFVFTVSVSMTLSLVSTGADLFYVVVRNVKYYVNIMLLLWQMIALTKPPDPQWSLWLICANRSLCVGRSSVKSFVWALTRIVVSSVGSGPVVSVRKLKVMNVIGTSSTGLMLKWMSRKCASASRMTMMTKPTVRLSCEKNRVWLVVLGTVICVHFRRTPQS